MVLAPTLYQYADNFTLFHPQGESPMHLIGHQFSSVRLDSARRSIQSNILWEWKFPAKANNIPSAGALFHEYTANVVRQG